MLSHAVFSERISIGCKGAFCLFTILNVCQKAHQAGRIPARRGPACFTIYPGSSAGRFFASGSHSQALFHADRIGHLPIGPKIRDDAIAHFAGKRHRGRQRLACFEQQAANPPALSLHFRVFTAAFSQSPCRGIPHAQKRALPRRRAHRNV